MKARSVSFPLITVLVWILYSPGIVFGGELGESDDPILRGILVDALDHYLEIKALRREVLAAEHELSLARGSFLPNLSYSGNQRFGSLYQSISSIEQPLITFGRWQGDKRRAEAELHFAKSLVDSSREELLRSVVDAYYDLIQSSQRALVFEDSVREHERLFELIDRRVLAEKSPAVDRALAEARLEFAKTDLNSERSKIEQIQARLQLLVGHKVQLGDWSDTKVGEDLVESELIGRTLAESQRMKRVRAERQVLEARRLRAESELLPSLSLVFEKRKGYFEIGDPDDERTYISLNYETGNGFTKRKAILAAKQREYAAEIRIDLEQQTLVSELEAYLAKLKQAKEEVPRSQQLAEATNSVRQSYLRQYTVGRKSWLDVMNASREWFSARVNQIQWRKELGSTVDQLRVLSGQYEGELVGDDDIQ
ncbi:MAG: TolC family protein [Betaproteobacteria bacterium]|jgi:adhesin transport system outer membrane protein